MPKALNPNQPNPQLQSNQQWYYSTPFINPQPQVVQQPLYNQQPIPPGVPYVMTPLGPVLGNPVGTERFDIENEDDRHRSIYDDNYDWYDDMFGILQPVQLPAVIPQQQSGNVINQIDGLISQLKAQRNQNQIDTGNPRIGKETAEATGLKANKQIIDNYLQKIISEYPEPQLHLSYDLFKSAYPGIWMLSLFCNGQMVDQFMVDEGYMYGRGCPVLIDGHLMTDPNSGKPEVLPNTIAVPLGSTLAMKQNLFRRCPPGNNYPGCTIEVYNEYVYRLMDQRVYYLVDLSSNFMPDDEEVYKEFGKKILKIAEVYPLTARYRLYHYESNDKFCLISDASVKPYNTNDTRPAVNTYIEVTGNNLFIKEPKGKEKALTLGD